MKRRNFIASLSTLPLVGVITKALAQDTDLQWRKHYNDQRNNEIARRDARLTADHQRVQRDLLMALDDSFLRSHDTITNPANRYPGFSNNSYKAK